MALEAELLVHVFLLLLFSQLVLQIVDFFSLQAGGGPCFLFGLLGVGLSLQPLKPLISLYRGLTELCEGGRLIIGHALDDLLLESSLK